MSGPRRVRNYIGGRFVDAQSGAVLDDMEPATGDVLATIPRSGAPDVAEAVAAADAALRGPWGRTSPGERADWLDAIALRIEDRLDELAALESRDQGKTVALARRMDMARAIANFRFFANYVRHYADDFHQSPGSFNYTQRTPIGVVGLITPWNLPLYLLSWKLAPALAMGNAVVAKPSELTPLTADALAEIVDALELPAGVFNVVHGLGAEAGQALVENGTVGAVSFTGGTATGRIVAAAAAKGPKKVSLELGGKNATVVFADADFELAVAGAVRAGFTNQGEICLCGSRVLVQRSLYDRFLPAFVERVQRLAVGDPTDPLTDIGALISSAHRDKVEGYLALANEEGGKVQCGGKRPVLLAPWDRGYFLEPTVITDLPITSRCATEEIFGPVVTVHPFDDEADAVRQANATRYGLAASVWTRDLGQAHRVSAALGVGMVWVNTWLERDLRVPFGGVKESGVGTEGGRWSLDFYSHAKNICVRS